MPFKVYDADRKQGYALALHRDKCDFHLRIDYPEGEVTLSSDIWDRLEKSEFEWNWCNFHENNEFHLIEAADGIAVWQCLARYTYTLTICYLSPESTRTIQPDKILQWKEFAPYKAEKDARYR